jgi:hypothetical protein
MVLYSVADFRDEPDSDTYVCPGNKRLLRKHPNHKDRCTMYKASSGDGGTCSLKSRCRTHDAETWLGSPFIRGRSEADAGACDAGGDEAAPMHGRASLRDNQVSHLRTPTTADAWIVRCTCSNRIATMVYNLKRITNVLGAAKLTKALRHTC